MLAELERSDEEWLERPDYWFFRAEALRLVGRKVEAGEAARQGLQRWPDDVGLIDSLGLSLFDVGDLRNAEAAFRSGLRLAPENDSLLAHLAHTLARTGQFDEAHSLAAALMRLDPDAAVSLETRARVAVLARDSDAEGFVRDLLAHDPDNPVAHSLLGFLAARRLQGRPAAEAFAHAAAINPGSRTVARAARETRIAAHPLLTPTRWIFMLGRTRARLLYLLVVVALFAMHQMTAAWVFAAVWLVFMVLVPRRLRAHYNQRYGEL